MEIVFPRCCGLDVHKETVVACLRLQVPGEEVHKEIRTFSTMTDELLVLYDWLYAHGVTHVAMESTGVYWKPIFNLLESQFEVLLVNAAHIKAVPGRKTDVKDCEWIADLLAHGLLRGSFIPPVPIRDLRDLTRLRKSLIEDRTRVINRLQKLLEAANIKLASVVTDVMGASARAMLSALLEGVIEPEALADLARGRLRQKLPELRRALEGRFRSHHRFLLEQLLSHIDFLDESIARISEEVVQQIVPFQRQVELLCTIPGISRKTAEVLISEIGTDMKRFPTAANLASWAGMCPGNHESAGKRYSGRTRKGNSWLRRALLEAAWAAARSKNCYLFSQYSRLVARRGKKKAAIAVAHSLLVIAYHVLKNQTPYRDLGVDFLDKLNLQRLQRYHVRRLENLGLKVTIEPLQEAA